MFVVLSKKYTEVTKDQIFILLKLFKFLKSLFEFL